MRRLFRLTALALIFLATLERTPQRGLVLRLGATPASALFWSDINPREWFNKAVDAARRELNEWKDKAERTWNEVSSKLQEVRRIEGAVNEARSRLQQGVDAARGLGEQYAKMGRDYLDGVTAKGREVEDGIRNSLRERFKASLSKATSWLLENLPNDLTAAIERIAGHFQLTQGAVDKLVRPALRNLTEVMRSRAIAVAQRDLFASKAQVAAPVVGQIAWIAGNIGGAISGGLREGWAALRTTLGQTLPELIAKIATPIVNRIATAQKAGGTLDAASLTASLQQAVAVKVATAGTAPPAAPELPVDGSGGCAAGYTLFTREEARCTNSTTQSCSSFGCFSIPTPSCTQVTVPAGCRRASTPAPAPATPAPAAGEWVSVPGSLRMVSVGSRNDIWGVNRGGEIYRWGGGDWQKVGGLLSNVAVGADGTAWGVGLRGEVFPRDGDWKRTDGDLKQISVGNAQNVWGVNSPGGIYRWVGGVSQKIDGPPLTNVAVGADGTVWGVGLGGEVFRRDGAKWTRLPGGFKQIAVGSAENVWGVNGNDEIWRWNGSDWVRVPGALTWVSVAADGTVWGTASNGNIYRFERVARTQAVGR